MPGRKYHAWSLVREWLFNSVAIYSSESEQAVNTTVNEAVSLAARYSDACYQIDLLLSGNKPC